MAVIPPDWPFPGQDVAVVCGSLEGVLDTVLNVIRHKNEVLTPGAFERLAFQHHKKKKKNPASSIK